MRTLNSGSAEDPRALRGALPHSFDRRSGSCAGGRFTAYRRAARLLLACLGLVVWAGVGPLHAEVLTVPGDHPDLESALLAAADDDVILVQTDDRQAPFGLLVTRPVTIVGDPVCNIDLRFGGVHLKGPGYGRVTLVNCTLDYASADENGYRSLWGGDFDELTLVGCRIVHENLAPSGLITSSYPAVDLFGEMVLTVVDSELRGGNAGSDVCAPPALYQTGREGVFAPDATVVLVNSEVTGGNGGRDGLGGTTLDICCASCSCPSDLSSWGGRGGDGIVAREVHAWNTEFVGGVGISWYAFPKGTDSEPEGTPVLCGRQPDGQPAVVDLPLVQRVTEAFGATSSQASLGGAWTLTWQPEIARACPLGSPGCGPGGVGVLVASLSAPQAPLGVGLDHVYVDPLAFAVLATFQAGRPGQLALPVPEQLDTLGLVVTAQVVVTSGRVTGPAVGVVVPVAAAYE